MSGTTLRTIGRAFRRTARPLGCYYLITLVLPLANGAGQAGGMFTRHALLVFTVPAALILCAAAIHGVARACLRVTSR